MRTDGSSVNIADLGIPDPRQSDAFQPSAGSGSGSLVMIPALDNRGRQAVSNGQLQWEMVDSTRAANFWSWAADQNIPMWRTTRNQMKQLGYTTDSSALSAIGDAISKSQNPYYANNDGSAINIAELISANTSSSSGGGGGGGPYTYKQKNINTLGEAQSQDAAEQAFQSELGRSSTKKEAKEFRKAFNMEARQNPQTTITRGNSSGGSDTRTTKTRGGFDANAFARDWARSQEGYGEKFAATTFLKAIDEVLSQGSLADAVTKGIANG